MRLASGKFVLRLEPKQHTNLRELAAKRGLSLNALITEILTNHSDSSPGSVRQAIGYVGGQVLPSGILEQIVEVWAQQLEAIAVFGSIARGDTWQDSDIDLFIVLRSDVEICRALYSQWDAHLGAFPRVSPQFVRMPKEQDEVGGIWYEVATEGVVIWDPVFRLSHVLQKLRNEIISGAVSRHTTHGHSYWVKQKREAA